MHMREVIVHLGFPKTGTTTIQNTLHRERSRLLSEEGLLYPSLSANLTNALCTMFLDDPLKHISNQMSGVTREEAVALGDGYRAELEAEINSAAWKRLLLSAEGLSNLSAQDLTGLRKWLEALGDRITAIVCVRHPLTYSTSVIQQIMKGGNTLDALYDHLPLPNYRGKLSNAIQVFGKDNVRILSFEQAVESRGGVVAEFVRQIGLPPETAVSLASRSVRDNESLSAFGVAVLDAVNRQRPMFVEGERNPQRSGRELAFITRLRGPKYTLPVAVAARVRAECVEDIEWLNSAFDTNLYPDLTDDPAKSSDDQRLHVFETDLVESVAEVIGDLVNGR